MIVKRRDGGSSWSKGTSESLGAGWGAHADRAPVPLLLTGNSFFWGTLMSICSVIPSWYRSVFRQTGKKCECRVLSKASVLELSLGYMSCHSWASEIEQRNTVLTVTVIVMFTLIKYDNLSDLFQYKYLPNVLPSFIS